MINKQNFKALLLHLNFEEKDNIYTKNFEGTGNYLKADFNKEQLEYPEMAGLIINERQTCNFSSEENVVVFECVYQLLNKGYKPKHIELEPKWKLGHGASGGRADILVKNQKDKPLLIIECKTYDKEFKKAWKDTQDDGGQLFSYAQQIAETEFLCLYASEYSPKEQTLYTQQRIISHKDNEKILEQDEKLKSFKQASNVQRRYEVWQETYKGEYTETGIFEENIQPYQIGKSNYTLAIDTQPVSNKDKDGKYHRFRTILRQHSIARKETAFEVLVNLFLAKIVDEEENPNNLKFFWKGVAYDNYYDFIDRLQDLYQIGMRKFLKDEVMYISNQQIDNAFWTVKNDRNATKKQIQKYFRNLKFFSNNAFTLINVHNEHLFNKNTKVLVELVQMWQGLRLKTKEQNQFLGDMFEYFLDNSIKQSEGQFFTPIPITKFIVASLPLEEKIKNSKEPLKAIDYACGSGHFLNEYAHQIKPYVKKHKKIELEKYYENIVGIEKEDRLAKIAKVSAYMYGQDQIHIIEEDALVDKKEVARESFDVLVANPPFAVEGFLLNLDDKQKHEYKLMDTTELNSNTNNIQCFFIERAKHLMAPNAVMGIVVPSSILSNSDATHIATREIILQYFDIVSLVELGSGTFGKTGTNTVVLFLKRKSNKPEQAEHYKNRVNDFFEGLSRDARNQEEYKDLHLIQKYCQHNDLPYEEYKKLFAIIPENITRLEALMQTEMFATYKKEFEASTAIKNLKKKKTFKDKSAYEQELIVAQKLIDYIVPIEKDKLYYYILAQQNPQKVLIIKSPSNNKEQKQFLGYEWSGAKGSEGIKYNGGDTVNDIRTPLFNPKNPSDTTKINSLIRQNFLGKPITDLKEFEEYQDLISYAHVEDLLDFSRKDFNKAFSLSPKKNITIDTKWELVKLEEVTSKMFAGGDAPKPNKYSKTLTEKYTVPIFGNAIEKDGLYGYTDKSKVDSECVTISARGTLGFTAIRKKPFVPIVRLLVLIPNNKVLVEYLKYALDLLNFTDTGSVIPQLTVPKIKGLKIPLPPKKVQEQIVKGCEAIDTKAEQAQQSISKAKEAIESEVSEISGKLEKLEDITTKIGSGATPKGGEASYKESGISLIRSQNVYDDGILDKGLAFIDEEQASKLNNVIVEKNDVLFNITGASIARCCLVEEKYLPARVNQHVSIIRPNEKIVSKYLQLILVSENVKKQLLVIGSDSATREAITKTQLEEFKIPVPPLAYQKKLVAKIEKLEKEITKAQEIINSVASEKQAVLDQYLK
ncbi:MAG: restriction endonuclease subunit S [Marinifilaceae bacterium]|jgi:type I restriction-modification system DNA methylase subunit|nr:restriction endonuclease subunit S [Marinifilaceae bacterium]